MLVAVVGLFAHPHVFMETRIEVAWNEDGVEGFWITWKFDKIFTASILMDFDHNKDQELSREEVLDVEIGAFSNLANYHYFLYIRSSEGTLYPSTVEHFKAYVEDGLLYYRFFVPYTLVVREQEAAVSLAVYDDTFFCDIGYAEQQPVSIPSSGPFRGSFSFREDRGIQINYVANDGSRGSTYPRQVVLSLRRGS